MSPREMMLPLMVDRISALPDEILCHILSFLPTKFAFTTGILSKRWTPLCRSLTALYFDDEGVQDEEAYLRFRHFVDKVLLSRGTQPIKAFCLTSRSKLSDGQRFKVDDWVEAANQRRVENLQLSTTWILPLSLCGIFTSRTLVILKLSGFLKVIHRLDSVNLPSLKTLHLIDISLKKREDLKKLLYGCPILEDLHAEVRILESGYTTGFQTLPNLLKARIRTLDVPFSAVCNVEFLRIEEMDRKARNDYINSYYKGLSVFQNLLNLELCFHSFLGWDRVLEVLRCCPKLHTLGIQKRSYGKIYREKWAYTEDAVPECVSSHLRTCSIVNYIGIYEDLKFVEYIMQNARFLQLMTLYIVQYVEQSDKDLFIKDVSECSRISPTCKIECN